MQEAEVQGLPEAEGLVLPAFGEGRMAGYPLISAPVDGEKDFMYAW